MLDWLNALDPAYTVRLDQTLSHDESNVYLIKETENIIGSIEWLRKNFKEIFAEELFEWWTDETDWPELSWENFEAFCEYRIFTVVYDAMPGAILKG